MKKMTRILQGLILSITLIGICTVGSLSVRADSSEYPQGESRSKTASPPTLPAPPQEPPKTGSPIVDALIALMLLL